MIKFTLTKILLEYDIRWERTAKDGRPECVLVEGQFVPNLKQEVVLTKMDQQN